MPTFECRDPHHMGEGEWENVEAPAARAAAELWRALYDWTHCEFPPDSTVVVRDGQGVVTEWTVEMRAVPQYSAKPRRKT